jgi:hypothetical protein
MARMLQRRDSTAKYLNAVRRKMRLCNRFPGTEKYVQAIQPSYTALAKARDVVEEKKLARETAYDYEILADYELDSKVKIVFKRCEVYDGENRGALTLPKIFPDLKFGDIINAPIAREPDLVEEVILRIEKLGPDHPLFAGAAELKVSVATAREAIQNLGVAIREQKAAEAEVEICKEAVRRRYELNYLAIRGELGSGMADALFPKLDSSSTTSGEADPEADSPTKAAA